MQLSISDQMVSQFFSGLVAVLVLVAVGGILSLLLGRLARRFPFTRVALILALAPLTYVRALEESTASMLYLYAMIVPLLGIFIDGIGYLLEPRTARAEEKARPHRHAESAEQAQSISEDGRIVWEKTD